ncbi:MAG: DUF4256 domain-containing protein [Clostridiales bacterium]|nr:DUF4256 domain-containing protein [Clostridiales bacterium]
MNQDELLKQLELRFSANKGRHPDLQWAEVEKRLTAQPHKLRSLGKMEESGGEPDVVGLDPVTGEYLFFDCSAESPAGRRNTCYDDAGYQARVSKGVQPAGSAQGMAAAMGLEILTEDEYRSLQKLGAFDLKTSSWLKTPEAIRKRGGALFADRRYDHVFVYHNSAPSFYGVRGFLGVLRV